MRTLFLVLLGKRNANRKNEKLFLTMSTESVPPFLKDSFAWLGQANPDVICLQENQSDTRPNPATRF